MHSCPGHSVATRRMAMYYALAASVFSRYNKCKYKENSPLAISILHYFEIYLSIPANARGPGLYPAWVK